jgi:HD superfamily phosphodiesterase
MTSEATILTAEKKYRSILEEFFLDTWSDTNLTSHGIDHHRRVWNYAMALLSEIPTDRPATEPSLPDKLIIASYLHDLGMAADPGFRHGKHGVYLCRQFLVKNRLNVSDYTDVLHAIENHDDKKYINMAPEYSLLSLLSVADDLDAFGYIGIYRYSEIYLTRGIPLHLLGYRIRENAEKRFMNFLSLFGFNAELADRHRKRFLILDKFFDNYNQESDSSALNNHEPSGYSGVIKIISEMIKDNISLNEILSGPGRFSKDPVISGFMKGLAMELREFRIK